MLRPRLPQCFDSFGAAREAVSQLAALHSIALARVELIPLLGQAPRGHTRCGNGAHVWPFASSDVQALQLWWAFWPDPDLCTPEMRDFGRRDDGNGVTVNRAAMEWLLTAQPRLTDAGRQRLLALSSSAAELKALEQSVPLQPAIVPLWGICDLGPMPQRSNKRREMHANAWEVLQQFPALLNSEAHVNAVDPHTGQSVLHTIARIIRSSAKQNGPLVTLRVALAIAAQLPGDWTLPDPTNGNDCPYEGLSGAARHAVLTSMTPPRAHSIWNIVTTRAAYARSLVDALPAYRSGALQRLMSQRTARSCTLLRPHGLERS